MSKIRGGEGTKVIRFQRLTSYLTRYACAKESVLYNEFYEMWRITALSFVGSIVSMCCI